MTCRLSVYMLIYMNLEHLLKLIPSECQTYFSNCFSYDFTLTLWDEKPHNRQPDSRCIKYKRNKSISHYKIRVESRRISIESKSLKFLTGVAGRGRTPGGEGRRTEDFLRLRPPQGRKRTADRQLFVSSGQRWTPDRGLVRLKHGFGRRTGKISKKNGRRRTPDEVRPASPVSRD